MSDAGARASARQAAKSVADTAPPCRRWSSSSCSRSSPSSPSAGRWRAAAGSAAATRRASSPGAAFYIFVPALLFRTSARTDFARLDVRIVLAFFVPTIVVLLLVYATLRFARAGAAAAPAAPSVRAITASFGNAVQIGIPLAAALYGESRAGAARHARQPALADPADDPDRAGRARPGACRGGAAMRAQAISSPRWRRRPATPWPCPPAPRFDLAEVARELCPFCMPALVPAAPLSPVAALLRWSGAPLSIARHYASRRAPGGERRLAAERFDLVHAEQLQALPQAEPAFARGVPGGPAGAERGERPLGGDGAAGEGLRGAFSSGARPEARRLGGERGPPRRRDPGAYRRGRCPPARTAGGEGGWEWCARRSRSSRRERGVGGGAAGGGLRQPGVAAERGGDRLVRRRGLARRARRAAGGRPPPLRSAARAEAPGVVVHSSPEDSAEVYAPGSILAVRSASPPASVSRSWRPGPAACRWWPPRRPRRPGGGGRPGGPRGPRSAGICQAITRLHRGPGLLSRSELRTGRRRGGRPPADGTRIRALKEDPGGGLARAALGHDSPQESRACGCLQDRSASPFPKPRRAYPTPWLVA